MRPALLSCVLILLALGAAAARADVSLQTPVVQAGFDNGQEDCAEALEDACLGKADPGTGPGSFEGDVYQEVDEAYVTSDLWLLPDRSMTIHGSDLYVEHPVFRAFTELWQDGPGPLSSTPVHLTATPENLTLYYPAPTGLAQGEYREVGYVLAYADDGMCYERCGPYTTPKGNDTDTQFDDFHLLCAPGDAACQEAALLVERTYAERTPNVRFGLELYAVTVTTGSEEECAPSP